ncbi:MAG: hypothetical protein HY881_02610 [Deltaproteobacteria bacterium]|nr:hypothetical protein [Deltaproteobacteria bacterium]
MKTCRQSIYLAALLLATVLAGGSAGVAPAQAFDQRHESYDRVLKRYVADGRVNYTGLKADSTSLEPYLDSIAEVPEEQFISWTESRRLAFLINFYNAATLKRRARGREIFA